MTQPNTKTSLADLGAANFLRGVGNDQKNQAHAMAMGQAQLRQMFGENYQAPPDEGEMKIAGQAITETVNYNFYGGPAAGMSPVGGRAEGGATDANPVASPAVPPPSATPPETAAPAESPIRSRVKALALKMLPLVLASSLGAGGIILGQIASSVLNPPAKQTAPPPVASPPQGPEPGPIFIHPDRPDRWLWELDLGPGRESNGQSNQNGMGQR